MQASDVPAVSCRKPTTDEPFVATIKVIVGSFKSAAMLEIEKVSDRYFLRSLSGIKLTNECVKTRAPRPGMLSQSSIPPTR